MVSCFTMFQQFPMSMSTVENFEIKTENHQANITWLVVEPYPSEKYKTVVSWDDDSITVSGKSSKIQPCSSHHQSESPFIIINH